MNGRGSRHDHDTTAVRSTCSMPFISTLQIVGPVPPELGVRGPFLDRARPTGHRDATRPHQLLDAVRFQKLLERIDLLLAARELDDKSLVRHVNDAAAEDNKKQKVRKPKQHHNIDLDLREFTRDDRNVDIVLY